ncbi:MAG: helix-turn-helix domain-containing protein [Alphaproteobacteria bacterium]|nr:helix-turn-helix domain-containing protein [Alphaproteobacteria bacterium]
MPKIDATTIPSVPTVYVEAARSSAALAGSNFSSVLSQVSQESTFKADAKNRTSSAVGPAQFLETTWLDMMRRHGAAYGLGELADQIQVKGGKPVVANAKARAQILELRKDPHLSAGMAARYLEEVGAKLEKSLGRPVSVVEKRMAYLFGPYGAAKLLKTAAATPTAAAADILPNAARANPRLFNDAKGVSLPAGKMVANLKHQIGIDLQRFAEIEQSFPKSRVNDTVGDAPPVG